MIIYPNAKINIGLNIINKRKDGYHNISSFFYPLIDTFDILEILPANYFSFSATGIDIPGHDNICLKAYRILKSDFNIPDVKIHLHKMIPIGAGLGGGSSDGAFTLKALNNMFDLGLTIKELEEYALRLGSDCPFFIENTPKYVEGVGDKMISSEIDLSNYNIRLISPDLHVSTDDAYAKISINKEQSNLLQLIRRPIEEWKGVIVNDFEHNIFINHPDQRLVKKKLYEDGAIYVSMTGSGSTFYGIFNR